MTPRTLPSIADQARGAAAHAALPSLADQVRTAAACAAKARAETVRAVVSARTSAAAQHMNAQRLALLQLMARTNDLTTRQLYEQVCATIKTTQGSLHHIIYDLRDRGWATSQVAPSRKGIRIGTGRVNSWRITTMGRVALVELSGANQEADTDTDIDDEPATPSAPRTGAH
jgi:hypothetical protein